MKILSPYVCCLFFQILSAQQAVVNHLTINDGLSQNYIYTMCQDAKGFLWFGTKDGLNRYDGYSFKIYRKDNADSLSLSDNNVYSILDDGEHALWIGTANGGLLKYDRLKQQFHRIPHDPTNDNSISSNHIRVIKRSSRGNFLIGTSDKGLNIYNEKTGKWKRYLADSTTATSIPNNHIVDVVEDHQGNLWVSGGGISRIDSLGVVHRVSYKDQPDFFKKSGPLFCDTRGRVWIADRYGLVLFDTSFHTIYRATDQNQFFWTSAMREDAEGNMWVTTAHHLIFIHGQSLQMEVKAHFPEERLSSSLLIDRSKNVWIGTAGWGLIIYNPRTDKFGRRGGNFLEELFIDEFKIDTKLINKNVVDFSLRGNEFRMPLKDSRGNIFIPASTGYVYTINPQGKISKHDLVVSDTLPRTFYSAFSVFEDRTGTVWINRNDMLVRFTGKNVLDKTIKLYPGSSDFSVRTDYSDITAHYIDRKGTAWFGTPLYGLLEFNFTTGTSTWYQYNENDLTSLSHNHVLCITEDPNEPEKYLWIGTDGGGLNKFNKMTKKFSAFTEQQGFPNNTVYGILTDERKIFWISTNKGLVQFNPADGTMRLYDVHDGLQSNEFNRKEYYKASDGKLYFGGVNGYNAFYPKDIILNSTTPDVVITDFRLFNTSVTSKTNPSILKVPIEFTEEIVLEYTDNVITFEFAGLEYTAIAKNQYQYKLDGFDKDWIKNGTSRTATYTNIDPGDYVFRVIASNGDDVWSEKEAVLRLIILPPFYMTWWFRGILVFIFLLIGPSIYYIRVTQLKREQKRQYEISQMLIESQEFERKRIAQEMHDSLGQELLVIKNRAVMGLKTAVDDSKEKRQLEQISDGATNILKLVRSMSHNLRPPELDRLGLTETIRSILANMRDVSVITVQAELDNIDGMINKNEEINVIRILQETLSNIDKHAGATEISVAVKVEQQHISLIIKDNGKGFVVDEVKRGMGLAGISERVRLLQGSFSIATALGQGTTLSITIPMYQTNA